MIEGKFGQAKNTYGLSNIKAKRADTSESWIGAIFFVMNLLTLSKIAVKYAIFCAFLKIRYQKIKIIYKNSLNHISFLKHQNFIVTNRQTKRFLLS